MTQIVPIEFVKEIERTHCVWRMNKSFYLNWTNVSYLRIYLYSSKMNARVEYEGGKGPRMETMKRITLTSSCEFITLFSLCIVQMSLIPKSSHFTTNSPWMPLGYSIFPLKFTFVFVVYSWSRQWSVASLVECPLHVFSVTFSSGFTSLGKAAQRPQINFSHWVQKITFGVCMRMQWNIFRLECFSWFPFR